MPWFKVDDALAMHMKAFMAGNKALGLWVRAGSWSMQQLTDGNIPTGLVSALGGDWDDAAALVNAGLWHQTDSGYRFHDWAKYQPTRGQVEAERSSNQRRQELSRNPKLRDAIRGRDGDFCRYCAVIVNWSDRKGSTGATYDHVDPHGENALDNLVVACRGCNAKKGQRTPEEAGMVLLEPRSISRSDLVTNQAPSRPVPTPTTTYVPESKSLDNRARSDEKLSTTEERMAAQFGVQPERVQRKVADQLGITLPLRSALTVAIHILSKPTQPPRTPMPYVLGAITRSPAEVAQYIHELGLEAA